VNIIDILT